MLETMLFSLLFLTTLPLHVDQESPFLDYSFVRTVFG